MNEEKNNASMEEGVMDMPMTCKDCIYHTGTDGCKHKEYTKDMNGCPVILTAAMLMRFGRKPEPCLSPVDERYKAPAGTFEWVLMNIRNGVDCAGFRRRSWEKGLRLYSDYKGLVINRKFQELSAFDLSAKDWEYVKLYRGE